MALVLKVDCRACNRECGDFKHLQEETIVGDEVKTFAALLNYCTTLEAFGENHVSGMPQNICNSCVEHLLQSYIFKKMVLKNERAYRERLQAMEKSKEDGIVLLVEEEQVVKEEIDIEDTMDTEEFLSENEVVEGNNEEPEYNGQEWVKVDKNDQSSVCESNYKLSERQKNDSMENVSIDNVEYSNDIVVINEADVENSEYENVSDAKKYDSSDNDDKDDDVIFVAEQLAESSNENKDKAKRKYTKKKNLSKPDLTSQYCGKVFNERNLLKEHSCLHTDKKQHVRKICGKKPRSKNQYNAHMLTHSDERNSKTHACELCDKRFYTAEQQKIHSTKAHMITNTEEISDQSKVFGKGSTQVSGYTQHMLFLHTNEYPYKCDCGRPFLSYNSLTKHKHSSHCTKCVKTFCKKSSLKRHMLLHERKDI